MTASLLTDPAFWLAVAGWFVVLLFAVCLCICAARADRDACRRDVSERDRCDALNRAAGPARLERHGGLWGKFHGRR